MVRNNETVQCSHCGWQHFAVSRDYAEKEVRLFNKYFNELPKQQQIDLYGGKGANISSYEHCRRCGKPADMVSPAKELIGSTIGPIIWERTYYD